MTLCDRCDLDVPSVRNTPEHGLLCPDCLHTATLGRIRWNGTTFYTYHCSCGWRCPRSLYGASARQLWRDHAKAAA